MTDRPSETGHPETDTPAPETTSLESDFSATSPPGAPVGSGARGLPDDDMFASTLDQEAVAEAVDALREQIGRLIVGQEAMVDELIACLLAGGHALIEGVPGVAKTLTARLLSRASGLDYRRVQFTPDLMPADVIGTSVFSPKTGEFSFHRGPVFGQIILIDEINRAPAKTQAALFEVMEERQATVDGITYPMAEPFMVLATQNPIEHEGTYRLPEAQLDRFLFKVTVGYPSLEQEVIMLERFQTHGGVVDEKRVEAVLSPERIQRAQAAVRSVTLSPEVMRYAARIVSATRENPALTLGGSPRATLALVAGAKAVAAMSGRDFATPEDVQAVVAPALRHRILLTPEREIEGVRPEGVLRRIIEEIDVPR